MPITRLSTPEGKQAFRVKKIWEVSPPLGWRTWPALIDEDSEFCRVQRRLLTNRCHRYITGNKFNKGQDASLRIEMGNPNLDTHSPEEVLDGVIGLLPHPGEWR